MPAARAVATPAAAPTLLTTQAISAGYSGSRAASIRAAMLLPRPEIRIPTFSFATSASPQGVGVVDHAVGFAGRRAFDEADLAHRLAGGDQRAGDLADIA